MEPESFVNRAEFDAFCDEQYPPGALTKTMRMDRRDKIAGWLKGSASPPRGSWKYRIVNRGYKVLSFPEHDVHDVLCLKGTEEDGKIEEGKYGEWRRVAAVEELYDILMDTHVRVLNHGGYRHLQRALESHYIGVPRKAVMKFVNLCSECRKNPFQQLRAQPANGKALVKLNSITRDFNRRCQIDVLDMRGTPDGQYNHVGLYTDHWTQFVTLFPMMGSAAEHVAYGLAASVYPYYGPPHFLHSSEGQDYAARVIKLSIDKWKGGERTVVPKAKPALPYMGSVVERVRELLMTLINTRATTDMVQGPLPWATWLGKIMFDINNKLNTSTGKCPYKRVFERTLLSSSDDTSTSSHKPSGSGHSSAGSEVKRKRKNSSPVKEGSVVVTSYKLPPSKKQLKRPHTFVAINSKR